MTAPVVIITSVVIGSLLPPRVVAALELDSVIPPPDTVEEDKTIDILKSNLLRRAFSSYSQLKT